MNTLQIGITRYNTPIGSAAKNRLSIAIERSEEGCRKGVSTDGDWRGTTRTFMELARELADRDFVL